MTANIDFKLISSDDHIIEPPDVWKGRLESKFQERAPRIIAVDGVPKHEIRKICRDNVIKFFGLEIS